MNNRKFLERTKPGDLWVAVGYYMEHMAVLRTVTEESSPLPSHCSHCIVNGSVYMFLGYDEERHFGSFVVHVLMSDGMKATMYVSTAGVLLASRFEPVN
jgi:hypothetical protein